MFCVFVFTYIKHEPCLEMYVRVPFLCACACVYVCVCVCMCV